MIHPYIVIDAPGYYGDEGGRVYSAHISLRTARRAVRRHGHSLVTVAHNPDDRYRKGDSFYRDMPPKPVGWEER